MASDFDDLLNGGSAPDAPNPTGTPANAGQSPLGANEPEVPAVPPQRAWSQVPSAEPVSPLLGSAASPQEATTPLTRSEALGRTAILPSGTEATAAAGAAPAAAGRRRVKPGKPAKSAKGKAASAEAGAEAPKGFMGWVATNRKLALGVGIPLASVLLVGGAFATGFALGQPSNEPKVPEVVAPDPRPVPGEIPAAMPIRTCTIADRTEDPVLGRLTGIVVNAKTGDVLYDRDSMRGINSRGAQLLLAGAAALGGLGTETRFETKVVAGPVPGSLVLVGGGDPTLTRGGSMYPGAPSIHDLAQQAKAAYLDGGTENDIDNGVVPIRTIYVDATLWNKSDNWAEGWSNDARSNGTMPRIVPLMVDGDRDNPGKVTSKRSNDPVKRAAEAFVAALNLQPTQDEIDNHDGVPQVQIVEAKANAGAQVLASVQSATVNQLVQFMIRNGDNTLAEMFGRHLSVTSGRGGGSDTVGDAVMAGAQMLGFNTAGAEMVDASGFSSKNRVPTSVYASLLTRLADLKEDDYAQRVILNALDKVAESGTLAGRFGGASKKPLKGQATGRAGGSTKAPLIAMRMRAADGTLLSVVFALSGSVGDKGAEKLESIFVGVYHCGANLAAYVPSSGDAPSGS